MLGVSNDVDPRCCDRKIKRMPEESSVSDILAELYVGQKVDEGLRQLDAGGGIPHDEVVKRMSKWLE